MKNDWTRRKALKTMGWLTAASAIPTKALADIIERQYVPDYFENYKRPDKPVTCITLGAGNRGNVYGNYAAKYPEDLDVVGVAEPIQIRRERYSNKHDIPANRQFTTWEHVFEQPKFADAVDIGKQLEISESTVNRKLSVKQLFRKSGKLYEKISYVE